MEINEGLAEYYGAMIGDGCLSRYFANYDKRWKHCVLMTGHTHDEPYYKKNLQKISIKDFNVKGYIRFRKDQNVTRFEIYDKGVFNFFKNLGFPIGLKKKLFIPKKILGSQKLSIACVRGIFDTDGSIYSRYSKKYKNHTKLYNYYKVIQFRLISKKIIKQIKEILNENNIYTTKIGIDKNSFVLRITHQEEIHKFMRIVKPSNNYHMERYLNNIKMPAIKGS